MSSSVGWKFLVSRRWLGYWSLLLVFSVVCALLGNWQFARRAEAQAEIARIDANYDATPAAMSELLPTRTEFDEAADKWTPVEVLGTYLKDEQLLVRNRPNSSQVGYEVLSPLKLASGDVFIVNRGWISAPDADSATAQIPDVPNGPVRVIARLKAGEPTISGRIAEENTVGTINLEQIESIVDTPTYTGAYGLLIEEDPAAQHGKLSDRPERDEGPHLSYALQWYVFILIACIGVIYAARQEYRTLNPDNARTRAEDDRATRRRSRKGLSDAEDEDALLDAQQTK